MLFNSLSFAVFFPIVVAGYFLLPLRYRNIFLLGASCYFYMYFNPVYILILVYTIVVDYIAGIKIEQNAGNKKLQRRWLYASLAANLGALVFFKYADFLLENFFLVLQIAKVEHSFSLMHILLPVGLSFHTFQAISYTVEVYRGNQRAERNFIVYSLYVMFFPQLVAGPIERPQRLLHQFKERHYFAYENFVTGAQWIIWGMFMKIVVADNLAIIVDSVYDHPQSHHGLALIIATIMFAFQIYGDFAGYSAIAKGTAKVLGFDLSINFNTPYFSKSVSEFWRRWHISLSGWFKEYVYIPLGGSRKKTFRNTFVTFALSGMWHGANFTYLVWGLINGVFVYINNKIKRTLAVPSILKIIVTFLLVDFCWIFFRASSMKNALYIISNSFNGLNYESIIAIGQERHVWLVSISMLSIMLVIEWLTRDITVIGWWQTTSRWMRILFLNLLVFLILFFGVFEHRTFIYFQF